MKKPSNRPSIAILFLICVTVAQAEDWIKDAATGCSIWNPNPSAHETIVWRGTIKEGKANGYGIAVWRIRGQDTERAEGQWQEGRLHGYAVWSHANGSGYEGQWQRGTKSGYGIYTWPDGISFLGEYQNDRRGNGRTMKADGTPQKSVITTLTRSLVYQAQDAAIQARKASTRARVENLHPTKTTSARPSPKTAPAPVADPSNK